MTARRRFTACLDCDPVRDRRRRITRRHECGCRRPGPREPGHGHLAARPFAGHGERAREVRRPRDHRQPDEKSEQSVGVRHMVRVGAHDPRARSIRRQLPPDHAVLGRSGRVDSGESRAASGTMCSRRRRWDLCRAPARRLSRWIGSQSNRARVHRGTTSIPRMEHWTRERIGVAPVPLRGRDGRRGADRPVLQPGARRRQLLAEPLLRCSDDERGRRRSHRTRPTWR